MPTSLEIHKSFIRLIGINNLIYLNSIWKNKPAKMIKENKLKNLMLYSHRDLYYFHICNNNQQCIETHKMLHKNLLSKS